MRDLNRRNKFARKGQRSGKFFSIDYSEAWLRLKHGEDVYEKVMPDHSVSPADVARIPWTLVVLVGED
jgi:hypothetical protein